MRHRTRDHLQGVALALLLLCVPGARAHAQPQVQVTGTTLSIGATPTPPSGSSVKLTGLGTRSAGQELVAVDASGNMLKGALGTADIPSVYTRRDVAEAINVAWSFNAAVRAIYYMPTTTQLVLTDQGGNQRVVVHDNSLARVTLTGPAGSQTANLLDFHAPAAPAGTKFWRIGSDSGVFHIDVMGDGYQAGSASALMTGTAVSSTARAVGWGASVQSVNPAQNYGPDLGGPSNKYRTIWGGELFLETIVAQQRITTMGGRFTVTPSNVLTRDFAAGDSFLCVKYNSFMLHVVGVEYGSKLFMEKNGQMEAMQVLETTVPALSSQGDYCYSVTRNLDGTGANAWTAGDGIVDTGKTGSGMIDQFAVRGLTTANVAGPGIDFMIRTGSQWNDLQPRASIGNLRGRYGYASDTYGFAAGDVAATYVTVDSVNGFRILNAGAPKFVADTAGNVTLTGTLVGPQYRISPTTGVQVAFNSGSDLFDISRAISIVDFIGAGNTPLLTLWTDRQYVARLSAYSSLVIGDDMGSFDGSGKRFTIWNNGINAAPQSLAGSGIRFDYDGIKFMVVEGAGAFQTMHSFVRPELDARMALGHPNYRWSNIYVNLPAVPLIGQTGAIVGLDPSDLTRLAYINWGLGPNGGRTVWMRNRSNTGECYIAFLWGLAYETNCP